MTYYHASHRYGHRLRNVLLLLPIIGVAFMLDWAVGIALAGGDIHQIEQGARWAIVGIFLFGVIVGGIYIFAKPKESVSLSWQTVLVSSYLSAIVMAVIFPMVTSPALARILMVDFAVTEDFQQRILLGMFMGLHFGSAVGLWICHVDEKATTFTLDSIVRYSALYLLMAGVVTLALTASVIAGRGIAMLVLIMLPPILRTWWMNRYARSAITD